VANRVQWEPRLSVGNASLDAQHQAILARCNALADCLDAPGAEGERRFDETFQELMALAREHFAAEEALLVRCGYAELEDYRSEREEFDYLSAEIITTENFDRNELQTFLALWWAGHILGAVRNHRACLEQQPAA
jgi:hemerythrin-like metal-binding protein